METIYLMSLMRDETLDLLMNGGWYVDDFNDDPVLPRNEKSVTFDTVAYWHKRSAADSSICEMFLSINDSIFNIFLGKLEN